MKFRIGTQLAIVLILVGTLAAGITGALVYGIGRDLLVHSAKNKLLTSTLVLSRHIVSARQEVVNDLHILSAHPDTHAVLAASLATPPATSSSPAVPRQRLEEFFRLIMSAHPAYLQIRIISASEHGLERIRVDRTPQGLVIVPADELQEKGHYSYVSETLKLAEHATYMSRITGRLEPSANTLDKPVMLLSMPVFLPQGKRPAGLAVVTIDINREFLRLSEDLPSGLNLFLANGQGDVLIHPDSTRTFGFDSGRRTLIQEEFPATLELLSGKTDRVLVETAFPEKGTSKEKTHASVAAFVRQGIEMASEDEWLYIGLSQPLADVLAESRQLGETITRSLLFILPTCLLLAILLAKFATRPINRLRDAARRFAEGQPVGNLPLERQDEFGDLARSFQQMQNTISAQFQSLQQNKNELEEMIRHDPLTGLANRRLLSERLEHAIALSQRGSYGVALLFIDLNGFKKINDTLGHDAGDTLLTVIADRLQEQVRVTDTVARLGGDEFVILLVGTPHLEAVSAIAKGLLESIQAPIPVKGQQLNVGACVGISRYPDDGETASELLVSSDHAMYHVKNRGETGFSFASTKLRLAGQSHESHTRPRRCSR